jgi:hypothetical protein
MDPDEFEDDFDVENGQPDPDEVDDGEDDLSGENRGGSDRDESDESDDDDRAQSRSETRKVRKPGRAEARIQEALERAKRAEERAERLERDREFERRQPQRSQHEVDAERRERLSLMSADEKAEFLAEETRLQTRQELARIEFNSADRADKADFRALCRDDRAVAAVAEDVEARLAEMRRNGQNADRETIATFFIGQRARERGGAAKTKALKKRDADLDRERGRPVGGARSNVPRPGGKQQLNTREALRARLKDITF